MKKQFNRMRQLASQNLGRSVFSFSSRAVAACCHVSTLLAFDTFLLLYLSEGPGCSWRNYLGRLRLQALKSHIQPRRSQSGPPFFL